MSATSRARSPIPWFGGKQKLCEKIVELMPAHDSYVEVFAGGASVLFTKRPSTLDVYNDRDDYAVNFFRVLRERADELVPLLELSPYARSEWDDACEKLKDCDDELERARLFYVVACQAYGGFTIGRERHPNGERAHGRGWGGEKLGRMHASRAKSVANRVDHIGRFVQRLRTVQIDCLDWRDCLDRYDHETALFYLDPPYVPETRRSGGYQHELSTFDHVELIERVMQLRGAAIVSGYDHPIYRPLVDAGFARHTFSVYSMAAQREVGTERDKRLEVVWASPGCAQPTLFAGVA